MKKRKTEEGKGRRKDLSVQVIMRWKVWKKADSVP